MQHDAPASSRNKRKRGSRKRKRPSGHNDADTAATKHQRDVLQGPQEEQSPDAESADDDHENDDDEMAAPLPVDERAFQEMVYMGSTRVVVGPGFQVAEMLFDDEFVTVRLTKPLVPGQLHFLQDEATFDRLAVALHSAEALVLDAFLDDIRAASARPGPTPDLGITVHLRAKRMAAPFFEHAPIFQAIVPGIRVSASYVKPPVFKRDPVLTRTTQSSTLTLTWAAGVATGGARLVFATAGQANAFLQSYLADQINLPEDCAVRLVGTLDFESKKKKLPPLGRIHVDGGLEPVAIYDEAKIARMSPSVRLQHEYVAVIL